MNAIFVNNVPIVYLLRKDVWNAGFSENRKILFTLFVNAILVCNVPIVKKNIVKMNRPYSTIRTLGRIYIP